MSIFFHFFAKDFTFCSFNFSDTFTLVSGLDSTFDPAKLVGSGLMLALALALMLALMLAVMLALMLALALALMLALALNLMLALVPALAQALVVTLIQF